MLKELKNEEFDMVYKIMEQSFPPEERRSYEAQMALLSRPEYKIYVISGGESHIKAFIAFYEYDRLIFIEHFAVSSEYRSQGLGAKILRELMQLSDKRFCLEAEPPSSDIACRRIGFYQRNGFFLNDYDYVQPSLNKNTPPVPLKIMSSGSPLDADEFSFVRELIYREVYGL